MVHSCVTREPLTVVAWGSPRVGEEANTPGLSAMGPFFQIRELWLWEPRSIEYGGTLVGAGSCLTEELCVPLCQVPPAASPLPHLSDRRQDVGIASRHVSEAWNCPPGRPCCCLLLHCCRKAPGCSACPPASPRRQRGAVQFPGPWVQVWPRLLDGLFGSSCHVIHFISIQRHMSEQNN